MDDEEDKDGIESPDVSNEGNESGNESHHETKTLEKIETYTGELKEFFNETKYNFKNIFFELIINTRAIGPEQVNGITDGTDYLVNPSNIKSNFSQILDKLKSKENLMEVLKRENTNQIANEDKVSKKFDIDEYQKDIDDVFSHNGPDLYIYIINYIELLIKFLFHKIGNKLNEDKQSIDNTSSFAKYEKFTYNTTTEVINSKLKNIIYEFLDFDNGDVNIFNDGKSIFLINDCADVNFAKKLTDKDYYKKKQKVKELLNTNKQYVDESFYRILDETIEALINIQNDKLIQSDATKTMTDILKISAERFLEKYNLVGKIFIKAVGTINKTTQELDNDNYLELEANSNNDLKKFDDDNRIFTRIADLLFISSNKSYMLGLGSAMGDSAIRGEDRRLFFPDSSVHDQPEGWGNTGALKSYITSIGSGLGATGAIIVNSRSKFREMREDASEVIKSSYKKLRKSREDASESRQAEITEKNRARDEAEAAATGAAQEARAAAARAAADAEAAAARMADVVRAATAARAAADAEAAAWEAAKREVEAAQAAYTSAISNPKGAAERALADRAMARAMAARAAAEALPLGSEKNAADAAAADAEAAAEEAEADADAVEAPAAEHAAAERLRLDAAKAAEIEAKRVAESAKVLADLRENEKKAAVREATAAAANRKKTAEAAGKAAEKANAEERAERKKINRLEKTQQEAAKTRAAAKAAEVKAEAGAQAAAVKAEVEREAQEAYERALEFANQKISEHQDATTVNTYQIQRDRVLADVKAKTQALNTKKQNMDNAKSEKNAAVRYLDQVKQDIEAAIVNVRQKKKDESDAKADKTKAEREREVASSKKNEADTNARDLRGIVNSAPEDSKAQAEAEAVAAEAKAQEAEKEENNAISNLADANLKVERAEDAVRRALQAQTTAQNKMRSASEELQDKERAEEVAAGELADARSMLDEKEIELQGLMQRAAEEKALPVKLLEDVNAARKAKNKLYDKTLEGRQLPGRLRRMVGIEPNPSAAPTVGGGSINDSISNVENTYNMIGGLKLDINPKFRRGYSTEARSRNYADDPVAVDNFTMYFLEITFGLQLLLKKLFSGNDVSQILRDFFSLYVKKLYTVLKPNISANTKLPIIVSNYSIYEITRKIIFSCFEKFIKENILNSDKSASEDSSDLDLSKDITLVKLSFSLPQLVDFFVESFTNLDNLDNNILKPGSNNALINYYNLKLGNVFNTSVEKKEEFALISDELTKIFKITDEDKKETNHLKFYREKIHKIDKIIDGHQDETFGLLIEQIKKIIPGFTITEKGLLFETTEFAGLKLTIQQPDLEKRKEELQKELADIQSKLTAATPPSTTSPTAAPSP